MIPHELSSEISGILKTKLYAPRLRGDLVPRPRLIEKINRGVQGKLVLVTAPAGFGKSTLLAEWAEQAEMPVVWLSLDRTDNHPHMFFSYFIASIQTRFPGFGESIQAALNSHASPFLYSLVNALINEITELNRPCAIVLDDFHRIVDPIAVNAVCHLVDHQPPQLHILIASRSELPTSCSRMRVRGELIQLGIEDLRFNSAETSAFMRSRLGRRISGEDIAILENRTEGWIAGLQMAVISMQAEGDVRAYVAGFSGADRLVTDYLLDEVLSRQRPELQDFMLKTSILDKLSAPLCNQVTGLTDSQRYLENLDRSGLFIIPLDSTRTWYRYHHLFAELLKDRLRLTYPDQVMALHKKASDWYLNNEMPEDAVEQIFAIQDYELIAHRIEQVAGHILARGKFKIFVEWLEGIPKQYVECKPYLVLVRAFMLFELSDLQGCQLNLEIADGLIGPEAGGKLQLDDSKVRLSGVSSVIKSAYYYGGAGDVERAYKSAEIALQYLPEDMPFWQTLAWMLVGLYHQWQGNYDISIEYFKKSTEMSLKERNLFLGVISNSILAKLYLKTGRLAQAVEICEEAIKLDERMDFKVTYSGLIYLTMAELCFLRSNFEAAERYTLRGIDLVEKHEDVYSVIHGYFNLARIYLSRKESDKAQNVMKDMVSLIQTYSPSMNALKKAFACQAYVWVYAGNLKLAKRWMENPDHNTLDKEYPFDVSSDYAYRGVYLAPQELVSEVLEFIHLTKARLNFAYGELEIAYDIIDHVLQETKNQKRIYSRIQFLIVKALVLKEMLRPEDAANALLDAIDFAAPENLTQLFLLEGEALYPILDRTIENLSKKEWYSAEDIYNIQFIEHLRSLLAKAEMGEKKSYPYGLTLREVEVIQCLAIGLSYLDSAEKLGISENTYRTHIKRIYNKLGVNNRLQAINIVEKLGLLDKIQGL
jgi:LuxR family maltose regulon positive regulatory protein